jgi:hypothetical protein
MEADFHMNRAATGLPSEAKAPKGRASTPHFSRGARTLAAAVLCAVVGACANEDAAQVTAPVVLGMTPSLAPAYDDGQLQLYQVQVPVRLPIRRPDDSELQNLGQAEPYPRGPWLKESDLRLEVRYTLTNLDDQPHTVLLMIDPWNEFVRYQPGIVVTQEASLPNLSGIERRVRLQPKSRVVGTLTNDDMIELAVDLATAENVIKNPPTDPNGFDPASIINRAFNAQNRSTVPDPIVSPYIPQVIAGLTGFDLGLRTEEQGTLAVEIAIDITDNNGSRVIPDGDNSKKIQIPSRIITPPGARPLN